MSGPYQERDLSNVVLGGCIAINCGVLSVKNVNLRSTNYSDSYCCSSLACFRKKSVIDRELDSLYLEVDWRSFTRLTSQIADSAIIG